MIIYIAFNQTTTSKWNNMTWKRILLYSFSKSVNFDQIVTYLSMHNYKHVSTGCKVSSYQCLCNTNCMPILCKSVKQETTHKPYFYRILTVKKNFYSKQILKNLFLQNIVAILDLISKIKFRKMTHFRS